MKRALAFYGRELVNNGSFWQLTLGKNAMAICWSGYVQPKRTKSRLVPPEKRVWFAKIVGSQPGCDVIVVRGRTPNEALRKLEKATAEMVRDFVRIFAGELNGREGPAAKRARAFAFFAMLDQSYCTRTAITSTNLRKIKQ